MTRIAFCDDDAALLHQMQDFLEQYRALRGVQLELFSYTKPMELLADIEAGVRFDVLFLDVLMPGINGINAAREIRQYDTAVQIIFVTSSSEFAVQSYVVGAYYYQLKPIWKDSFFRLTDAVLAECRKRTQHSLILRCKSGVTRITLDSLEYCEVQGRTLVFHLLDGTVIESSGSMDELARQLADYPGFLRPHRSYLVNMEYIQNITAKSPKAGSAQLFAADAGCSHGSGGEHTMKKNELLSVFRSLQSSKGRTSLAVAVGVLAMLLLLLSELLPGGDTQKAAASTAQTATVSQYQTQLEQQLEGLISQLQGAGRTTVMITLTTGEETIYAVDTQTGELQQQETHVLLQDGSALAETTYLPQVCGVAVLCEGGGDVRIAARITELLHSLLDLPTNRICVEQRKR